MRLCEEIVIDWISGLGLLVTGHWILVNCSVYSVKGREKGVSDVLFNSYSVC